MRAAPFYQFPNLVIPVLAAAIDMATRALGCDCGILRLGVRNNPRAFGARG
jgi:hypothetical protein